MAENQVDKSENQPSPWLNILALVLSFFGVLVCVLGALAIYSSEAQTPSATLWPLPGLILLLWAILGIVCFLLGLLTTRQGSLLFLQATWFVNGTFIPLIILGAFSIGPLVLVAFLLFVISTILLSIRQRPKWLNSFSLFLLGAVCNLVVLLLTISLGNTNY